MLYGSSKLLVEHLSKGEVIGLEKGELKGRLEEKVVTIFGEQVMSGDHTKDDVLSIEE